MPRRPPLDQTDFPVFHLTETFTSGHQTKLKPDEVDPGSSVLGSQNFILDDDGKWMTRPGSQYLGSKSTLPGTVKSAGRLRRRDGVEIPVITHDQYIRFFHPTLLDWVIERTFMSPGLIWGFAANDLNTDTGNKLCQCNGVNNFAVWLGAVAVVANINLGAGTVTVTGTATLAQLGFTPSGNFSINGWEYHYTGLDGAQSFTGVTLTVTPIPALPPAAVGDGLSQLPVEYASQPKTNILLGTDNARVIGANFTPSSTLFIGGGQVFGSKTNDPTDWSQHTPRTAGDGFIINVPEGGGSVAGLAQFETDYYIFKGACIKKMVFTQDGNDLVQMTPLSSYDERTSSDAGSVSPLCVFRFENSIAFVTPTNVVTTIQRLQQYDYPQILPISDPIKATVDSAVFDATTCGIGWRGRAFIACKKSSTSSINDMLLVYDGRYKCWYAPVFGLNISAFFVYNGNLYGCLGNSPDTVQIWTGSSDFVAPTSAGVPIDSQLNLAFNNYGSKSALKTFTQFYIEGEMTQTGSATFEVQYNENGPTRSGTLKGTETGFFYTPAFVGGFGTEEFGVDTFGPSGPDVVDSNAPVRFRMIVTTTELPFFNIQFRIKTSNFFKLIACGPNIKPSEEVYSGSIYKALV